MLPFLLDHTNFIEFLSVYELSQLRETCVMVKDQLKTLLHPHTTWIQKCRFCDSNTLWEINNTDASCYKPETERWIAIYWNKKLPSIVPHTFWSYFSKFMKGYMTLSKFEQWCQYNQEPLFFYNNIKKFEIRMRIDIMGTFVHDENFFPNELQNIDEFISVGVSIINTKNIHDGILGLNSFSIGWHSDDGNIYLDSLVIGGCGCSFGKGDVVEVIVDYLNGMLLFEKNFKLVYIYELSGEFLCNPLLFSVVCKTKNSIFFDIQ